MTGCEDCKRSPNGGRACRLWVGCQTYRDFQRLHWNLSRKEYDWEDWYKNYFRGDNNMVDVGFVSG